MEEVSGAPPSSMDQEVNMDSASTDGAASGSKMGESAAADGDAAKLPKCKSRNRTTDLQLSMLEKSSRFYHAWLPASMESLEEEYHDGAIDKAGGNVVLVKGLPPKLDDNGLRDFFSLFGPVINANISWGVGTIAFEEGSEGVAKVLGAQPVKIYGKAVEITTEQHPENGRRRRWRVAPFPIVVAPPDFGPLQKPPARSSWETAERRMHKNSDGGAANKATEALASKGAREKGLVSSAPSALPSQQRKASLHSLLSEPSGNSLFEDEESTLILDASRRRNGLREAEIRSGKANNTKHFHCDDTLAAWIWPTGRPESELSRALARGHAVNAELPLLATVSGIQTTGCEGNNDPDRTWLDTNLHLLHKEMNVTGEGSAKPGTPSQSKLYQAQHPCLAPLLSVSKCVAPSLDEDQRCSSVLSVFDTTPSCRSLHELLRTDDFFAKSLFPGAKGHTIEPLSSESLEISATDKPSPLPWLRGNGEQGGETCSCHKVSDRKDDWRVNRYQHASSQPNLILDETDDEAERHPVHFFSELNLQKMREGGGSAIPPPKLLRRRLPWKRFEVGSYYRANVADLRIRFFALQLFHAVSFCHSSGITLGEILRPSNIFVQEDGWIRLVVPVVPQIVDSELSSDSKGRIEHSEVDASTDEDTRKDWRSIFHRNKDSSRSEAERPKIIPYPGYGDIPTVQWERGQISNLCYLMMLNTAAGRTVGDQSNPPILPWVTSFSSEITDLDAPDKSWRDLSKTKFRLTKGDEQLDQTFTHANPPHHVPESICELTYAIYRARCLPQDHLKRVVRGDFNPGHYPSSIQKMYEWTPDEATLEFYCSVHPSVFKSMHSEMDDLALPNWCRGGPESFVEYHRRLLESDYVSRHLHLWVDLNFGEALSGTRAVVEKNLPISTVRWADGGGRLDQCQGKCHSIFSGSSDEKQHAQSLRKSQSQFVQLFLGHHPRRHSLQSKVHSASQKLRSALTPGFKDLAEDGHEQVMPSNNRGDVHSRMQRDVSTIGAILKECYISARAIPPPVVKRAIERLLRGTLDIRQSLKSLSRNGVSTEDLFPFPQQLGDTYQVLFSTQTLAFRRGSSGSELGPLAQSTQLEQVWKLIQNPSCLKRLSSTSTGLILPTVLSPVHSIDPFVENCAHGYYPLFADRLGTYLDCLSSIISADLIVAPVFDFLEDVLAHATGIPHRRDVAMEELGKIFLSGPLLHSLYLSSSGEVFIDRVAAFVTRRLCAPSASTQPVSLEANFLIPFVSMLAHEDALGPGLCCKYIIPLLVQSIERASPSKDGHLCVKAMQSLLPLLPADTIAILVSKPVLRCCSQLCKSAYPKDNTEVFWFVKDLVVLLRSCLRHMNPDDIAKYYLRSNPDAVIQVLTVSFGDMSTKEENLRSNSESSVELLKETSALVHDVIGYSDARHYPDVFMIVEKCCSWVNDTCLSIALGQSRTPDEVMSLPGIEEALMISKKAVDTCGRDQIKAHCPAAIEFLFWLDEVRGVGEQEAFASPAATEPLDAADVAKQNTSYNDHLNEDGNGMFLEMRAPKRQSYLPPVVGGDESSDDGNGNMRETAESNRFQHPSQSFIDYEEYSKLKRDLAWVLGLHKEETHDCQVRYKWHCRMMLATELSGKTDAAITCMAVNQSESLLATGNNRGEVLLYDLRRHPPTSSKRKQFGRADINVTEEPLPIRQAEFFQSDSSVLVCNGGLHIYDAETQATISSLSPENTYRHNSNKAHGTSWKGDTFVGFTVLPRGSGLGEMIGDSTHEFAAISSNHVYTIDVRCSDSFVDHHKLLWGDNASDRTITTFDNMFRGLVWNTATKLPREEFYAKTHTALSDDKASFDLKCVTSHADWICTGSLSGHIHCFDRRRGTLMHCWKGHAKSVEYLSAISRHRLLSVGGDKMAILWDMTTTPPAKISSIYNIPGKEGSMNIASHQFRKGGLVSMPGDGDLLLCAAAGRKAVFMSMPQELQPDGQPVDVPASRIVMSDYKGNRMPKSEKLSISSIALLPCRQLVLLGCEKEIHTCL